MARQLNPNAEKAIKIKAKLLEIPAARLQYARKSTWKATSVAHAKRTCLLIILEIKSATQSAIGRKQSDFISNLFGTISQTQVT